MPRVRIPVPAAVTDRRGASWLCFVEGYEGADGRLQVRFAFGLADESGVRRTPLCPEILENEEALREWARALPPEKLQQELARASGEQEVTPPVPRHRC